MAKKGLLKKIFGKGKSGKKTKDAVSSAPIAIASGAKKDASAPGPGTPKLSPGFVVATAATGEYPTPNSPPASPGANACDVTVDVTMDVESEDEIPPQAAVEKISEVEVESEDQPMTPSVDFVDVVPDDDDQVQSQSAVADASPADVVIKDEDATATVDAEPKRVEDGDENGTPKVKAALKEGDGNNDTPNEHVVDVDCKGQDGEVEVDKGEGRKGPEQSRKPRAREVVEVECKGQESEFAADKGEDRKDVEKSRTSWVGEASPSRKSWAEQRMSAMYASSSSSARVVEKPKIEVGHEFNAERRKWIAGLSVKKEITAPHTRDDVKSIGKLSDRMKAVEQALHNSGKDDGSPNASNALPPAHTRSREKAAAQRKAVEEMLQKQHDPKAFLDSNRRNSSRDSSPGKEGEKKNDNQQFLHQRNQKEEEGKGKDKTIYMDEKEEKVEEKLQVEKEEEGKDKAIYMDEKEETVEENIRVEKEEDGKDKAVCIDGKEEIFEEGEKGEDKAICYADMAEC